MNRRVISHWTVGATFFLLFFRARYAFTIYSGHDDLSYVLWLKKVIGLPSPISFSNTSYTPGIAFLWLPAGLLARLLSRWWSFDLVLPTLIALSSFLMWVSSYVILDLIVEKFNQENPETPIQPGWSLLWLLTMPLLFYATNRTTLVHPGEVLTALGVIWAIQRQRLAAAVSLCLLLTLIRLNDLLAFAVIAGYLLDTGGLRVRYRSLGGRVFITIGSLASVICAAWALSAAFLQGYNGVTVWRIVRNISLGHLVHVVASLEWGLLYTGLPWLIVLVLGIMRWRTLSWTARGAWLWMFGEYLICVGWPDNGMEFGYRYLLGGYVAAIPVYMSLRRTYLRGHADARTNTLLRLCATWMCYLTWIYKTNSEVTIGPTLQGYGNPTMQIQALRQWMHPVRLIRPFFLSPPATVAYSWFLPRHPITAKYALSGFPLLALTLATACAMSILLTQFLRIFAHSNRLPR